MVYLALAIWSCIANFNIFKFYLIPVCLSYLNLCTIVNVGWHVSVKYWCITNLQIFITNHCSQLTPINLYKANYINHHTLTVSPLIYPLLVMLEYRKGSSTAMLRNKKRHQTLCNSVFNSTEQDFQGPYSHNMSCTMHPLVWPTDLVSSITSEGRD